MTMEAYWVGAHDVVNFKENCWNICSFSFLNPVFVVLKHADLNYMLLSELKKLSKNRFVNKSVSKIW